MKAIILAGGLGSRLSEETYIKPKPMVEIGGKPILWHIMKTYSHYGITDFIICCGYKGYVIKEYFANFFLHSSDFSIDLADNNLEILQRNSDPWKVTLVDTGDSTMTAGRLKKVSKYLNTNDSFFFTYGDGVADVDLNALLKAHLDGGKKVTVTGVLPPGRFGALQLNGDTVTGFIEKPAGEDGFINGGFFIVERSVIDMISGDNSVWETDVLSLLTKTKDLGIYKHLGFWQPMDTLREKHLLDDLWKQGNAPWKVWE
ncbi:glucose-1-phosphate cytidylyltransferase [Pseudomonadota bacterium]|nr:glucose-1-phosphate cytidylyltransferase [Pseudomonadota bacterium]